MTRRLTDLQLERFSAGELGETDRASVEKILAASPEDAEALRLIHADNAAYFTSHPAPAFVAKVAPEKKERPRWWYALGALATVALISVVTAAALREPEYAVKGNVAWRVATQEHVISDGHTVHAGETLTFQVTAPMPKWVAVVSHAPDGWFVYSSQERVPGGLSTLATAAQLDETKGSETLYLISSDDPFEAEKLKELLSKKKNVEQSVEVMHLTK